jgi:hypothetical protein
MPNLYSTSDFSNFRSIQMSDELNYRVLPQESKYEKVPIADAERKDASDLIMEINAQWAGIIVAIVICGVSVLIGSTFINSAIIGIIVGILAWVLVFMVKAEMSTGLERKRLQLEHERINEAEKLTSTLLSIYNLSMGLLSELRQHLNTASLYLENAEREFQADAFAPFWDAVEESVQHLSALKDKTNKLSQNADDYYRLLKDREHTFPAFPVQAKTLPDTSFITKEFRRVVRLGETNFQFANIWEHRRTRKAIIMGFQTLGEAVNNLGVAIEDSMSSLERSVSSDLAKVVEAEIDTRNKLDGRLLEQNRMLDNIQHHRKPDALDRPSKQ